jgi:hypothetical protein
MQPVYRILPKIVLIRIFIAHFFEGLIKNKTPCLSMLDITLRVLETKDIL